LLLDDSGNRVSRFKELNVSLLLTIILMLAMSLALVYSAGNAREDYTHFNKQLVFVCVGIIVLFGAMYIPPRMYYALAYLAYGLSILLLISVLAGGVFGLGAKRWIIIGGFTLQPSEPAKLAFVLAASRLLSDWRDYVGWKLIGAFALLAAPITLLVMIQPDLGTSTVFVILSVTLLAWYGLPIRYFLVLFLPLFSMLYHVSPALIGAVALIGLGWLKRTGLNWIWIICIAIVCGFATMGAPIAWDQLEPYQKKRLTTFMDPSADPLGSGYQVIQSQVAIGSGGFAGMGYLNGAQTQLRFLPEQHTDFIFSLAGEEFGFIGTSLILFLYSLIGWFGFRAAAFMKNQFMSLVTAGMTVMILYHSVINIGMALGNLPVTGLPLPFLSYGGSFMLSCLCAAGMILSASLYRREY
jgi:rod shape determining protein RodA